MKAVKSVRFDYTPNQLTRELLETFREMVNEAIKICLQEDIRGRFKLRNRIYREFQEKYGVASGFPYSVAEVAWSIAKKHKRWGRMPVAKKLMMKLEAQKYDLRYSILILPFRKGERILLPLQYGEYQRSFLMDSTLKRGSVTITETAIIIAFSKEVVAEDPSSKVGVDVNEKSVVCSDGSCYDLSAVARLHTEYGVRRSEFYRKHPHDRRLKKKQSASRERERIKQLLHRTAKGIVESARSKGQAIILEKLTGIRHVHGKGNKGSRGKRRRISHWPFRILQEYIAYKAAWSGVQVEFVSAAWTSQSCNRCHHINRNLKLTEREWRCPNCGAILDRDLNAAINIEGRGKTPCLGVVRPGAQGTHEAVKGNEQTSAPILRAEALKLSSREHL